MGRGGGRRRGDRGIINSKGEGNFLVVLNVFKK